MSRKAIKLTNFERPYDDQMAERFDIVFGNKNEAKPSIDDGMDALFEGVREALKPELTGYVPSFRDVFEWAEEVLPSDYYFEEQQEKMEAALENLKEFPFYDEIPQELLDWAEGIDWDSQNSLQWMITCPINEKSGNFLAILIALMAQVTGAFEGSIENIINEQEPETGESWHAAMAMHAIKVSVQKGFKLCDEIVVFLTKLDDLDEEKLSKELERFLADSDSFEELRQSVFEMGWLYRDHWWRQTHGEAAKSYYERVESLNALDQGRAQGTASTKDKAGRARDKLKEVILLALERRGFAFAVAPVSVQAETIREIAEGDFVGDFEFRKGELLSVKWFEARLEDIKASGDLAKLAEQGLASSQNEKG